MSQTRTLEISAVLTTSVKHQNVTTHFFVLNIIAVLLTIIHRAIVGDPLDVLLQEKPHTALHTCELDVQEIFVATKSRSFLRLVSQRQSLEQIFKGGFDRANYEHLRSALSDSTSSVTFH